MPEEDPNPNPDPELNRNPDSDPNPNPNSVSEEDFWRNYFSHVFAVKRSFADPNQAPLPNGQHEATGEPHHTLF